MEFSLTNTTFEAPVPLPAAAVLFAPVVAALGLTRKRRRAARATEAVR